MFVMQRLEVLRLDGADLDANCFTAIFDSLPV